MFIQVDIFVGGSGLFVKFWVARLYPCTVHRYLYATEGLGSGSKAKHAKAPCFISHCQSSKLLVHLTQKNSEGGVLSLPKQVKRL